VTCLASADTVRCDGALPASSRYGVRGLAQATSTVRATLTEQVATISRRASKLADAMRASATAGMARMAAARLAARRWDARNMMNEAEN